MKLLLVKTNTPRLARFAVLVGLRRQLCEPSSLPADLNPWVASHKGSVWYDLLNTDYCDLYISVILIPAIFPGSFGSGIGIDRQVHSLENIFYKHGSKNK